MTFHNAKLIPGPVPTATYLRQEPGVKRGNPGYVMSRSDLMEFLRCPARWKAGYKQDDTDATEWGSLVDCLLTCREAFPELYAVEPAEYGIKVMRCPKCGSETDSMTCRKCNCERFEYQTAKPWNNNATECMKWAEAQEGKTVVKQTIVMECEAAVAALRADPVIAELVDDSDFQVMIVGEYHNKETGIVVPVKCLIDGVPRSFENLWDLKTGRNGSPGLWPRVVFDRAYDMQASLSLALFNAATGEERNNFAHLVSENAAPYQTARYTLGDDFLMAGRVRVEAALSKYAKCLKSGNWPGYESSLMTDTGWMEVLPAPWMMPNAEEIYGKLVVPPDPYSETDLIP
jgi:hypothetical protein